MERNTPITGKIVLVGGCFDVLHIGHIQFLEEAKRLGDSLVVALESDENVKKRKGQNRPIHTQDKRHKLLSALKVVDSVIDLPFMKTDADYNALVLNVRPAVIAITQGDPYKEHKEKQAAMVGAIVVEIPKVHTPSTSQLAKLLEIDE